MRKVSLAVSIAVIVSMAVPAAHAVSFSVGKPSGSAGGNIVVPVNINASSSEVASTLQFDIAYDPSKVTPIEVATGAAAKDVDKAASYNIVKPGLLRVVEAGMNQRPVTSGSIADITFKPVEAEPTGKINLKLSNTVVADGSGSPVASNGVDGTFDFAKVYSETSDAAQDGGSDGAPAELEPIPDEAGTGSKTDTGGLKGRVVVPGLIDEGVSATQPGTTVTKTGKPGGIPAQPGPAGTPGGADPELMIADAGPHASPASSGGTSAAVSTPDTVSENASSPAPPVPIAEPSDGDTGSANLSATQDAPAGNEVESSGDKTGGGRTRMLIIEGIIVAAAIVLFLGARKLFHV